MYGVLTTLTDSMIYLYDNPVVTYTQLLAAARKVEGEVVNGESGKRTV